MHYNHFTEKEREFLYFYLLEWKSQKEIALLIWKHPSSISREIKRNSSLIDFRLNSSFKYKSSKSNYHYLPNKAHIKYKSRKNNSLKRRPILKWAFVRDKTIFYLKLWYSPQIISWVLKKDWIWTISHEAIYKFIYHDDYKHLKLREYLPMRRKRRKKHNWRSIKKTKIPNRIDISMRSEDINNRKLFGNWESDSIEWLRWSWACLHVDVERKTRYTKIKKLNRKTAKNTVIAMREIFWNMDRKATKSITPDNWAEFTYWEIIKNDLNIDFYFTHPYSSREKWTVERINWFIRRFFPKWTNFKDISEEQIQYVEDRINNRPMQVLWFRSPKEMFHSELNTYN